MKDGRILKSIDELGRLGIPKHMRQALGVNDGEAVELTLEGDTLIIRKSSEDCLFCGGKTGLITFNGKQICAGCISKLTSL